MALNNYYDIADLTTSILFDDKKDGIVNIDSTLLRGYPAVDKCMRGSVYRQQDGKDHRWPVNVEMGSEAVSFGPFAILDRPRGDSIKQASMQLRGTTRSFSFDILEEVFNRGKASIINHVKVQENNAKIRMIQRKEELFWSNAAYANREVDAQGILYWLPYCASEGFVGTYPTSYTDVAGIDPGTYEGWKSYGNVYVDPSPDDLILKTRTALSKTKFVPPKDANEMDNLDSGYSFGMYANLDTVLALEDEAKNQNDNAGTDLDYYHNKVMIRKIPITEVPTLDSNARDPLIGINWGYTKNHTLEGWWFKRKLAPAKSDQPLVVTYDFFSLHQLICYNRREGGFNIAKAA